MSVSWTEEQQKVIDVRNKNVLVSAAAGSGKTAVLVERILSLVCGEQKEDQPLDVDRLLVVTFTNAAAAEMRERVGLALEKRLEAEPDNIHLQRQQTLIHNAQVTTIHSFCQYVIRNYFYLLDLDPAFRIGDEGELKLLKGDVIRELLEERYAERRQGFLDFVETYATGKNDTVIEELILQLYEFSVSYPYPKRWLQDCVKVYETETVEALEETGFMQFLLQFAEKLLLDLQKEIQKALELCREPGGPYMYTDALQSDLEQAERLCTCRTYEEYRQALGDLAFVRLSAKKDESVEPEKKEQVKHIREGMKKSLKELKEKYFADSEEEVLALLHQAAVVTRELISLTEDFADRYREKKRSKNLADFTDLEHLALEILVEDVRETKNGLEILPTDAARELSRHYAQIMIDEYQDSNLIQEIILNSVSRKEAGQSNVFMVGDVKQSIYRFRLARPELFMEKYHTYPLTEECSEIRIDLHKNFRSRREVLEGTNHVFWQIMTPGVGGIAYDEAAALYPGASMPEPKELCPEGTGSREYAQVENTMNVPELWLLETDAEEMEDDAQELTARELEAKAAADGIRDMLAHNQVWDKEKQAFRPVRYGDIVILLRSLTGWGDVFARVLTAEGIPAHTESRTGYFTTMEIQTVLNLLRVVDNPRQDIPLAAVLKSMIGGFSDQELAQIKSQFPERPFHEACLRYAKEGNETLLSGKLKDFYAQLEEYRSRAEYLSIHEFLWYLLEDTGYGDYLAAQPGGKQRKANVQMLIQRAIAFEHTSYRGLFHFIRYIEQLQSYKEDFGEAGVVGENEDAVRIMTIHKSKGLEFPIVLVAGLGKSFNRQDTRSRVVMHPDLGLGVDHVDLENRVKTTLLPKKVLQKALDLEMLGEELRVLYVAFTRAKEKLILLGGTKKLSQKLEICSRREEGERLSFSEISKAGTYLDWILPAAAGRQETPFAMRILTPKVQAAAEAAKQVTLEQQRRVLEQLGQFRTEEKGMPMYLTEREEDFAKCLEEQLGYQYPYAEETVLRTKISVSELKRAGQTEEEDADTLLYPREDIVPYIPRFMQESEQVSGAARGTAYHKVLECMDWSEAYHSERIKEVLVQLTKDGKLTREQASAVRPYDIYLFAQTELAKRMMTAKKQGRLRTEQPFVIRISARELDLGYESEEPILVQGIIDAYFTEPDGLVIVDYKTDYVKSPEELLGKYQRQLEYYGLALERLTGQPVKEKILYSFCLHEMIPVKK